MLEYASHVYTRPKQEYQLLTVRRLSACQHVLRTTRKKYLSGEGLVCPSPDFYCAGASVGPRLVRETKQPGRSPPLEEPLIVRPQQQQQQQEDKVRVNRKIRARQIRVIAEDGEQLGIMTPDEALRLAESQSLDLVEVAPKAVPPVCRIMDYGKYRYDQKRRAREARKHQHTVSIKEIKFRPKIDKHDFAYKREHVRAFLEEGSKVKVTIMFRGREMAHPEFGKEIIKRVVLETADLCVGEYDTERTRLEGRTMSLVLTPSKVAAPAAQAPAAQAPAPVKHPE